MPGSLHSVWANFNATFNSRVVIKKSSKAKTPPSLLSSFS
ncbi:unnamed protein product, partial [Rotaria magnacalcarata]